MQDSVSIGHSAHMSVPAISVHRDVGRDYAKEQI